MSTRRCPRGVDPSTKEAGQQAEQRTGTGADEYCQQANFHRDARAED